MKPSTTYDLSVKRHKACYVSSSRNIDLYLSDQWLTSQAVSTLQTWFRLFKCENYSHRVYFLQDLRKNIYASTYIYLDVLEKTFHFQAK